MDEQMMELIYEKAEETYDQIKDYVQDLARFYCSERHWNCIESCDRCRYEMSNYKIMVTRVFESAIRETLDKQECQKCKDQDSD